MKILAIGRNYAAHAKELGNAVPIAPFFFLKPSTAIIWHDKSEKIVIPKQSKDVHHEVEVGVVIGKRGKNVSLEEAMGYVKGYRLCLDMTARDLQDDAKKKGLPWSMAKGFDTFCPITNMVSPAEVKDHRNIRLYCKVDGVMKQDGNTKDMMFDIPHLISFLSTVMTLEEDDLILTGTPSGVGPVRAGQRITIGCDFLKDKEYTWDIVDDHHDSHQSKL